MEILTGLFEGERRQLTYPQTESRQKHHFFERDRLALLIFSIGELLSQTQLTVYLAIAYLDNLIKLKFTKANEELTAVVCFLIASKFNEVDDNIPKIRQLIKAYSYFSQHKLSKEEILDAEVHICQVFAWNLDCIVPS